MSSTSKHLSVARLINWNCSSHSRYPSNLPMLLRFVNNGNSVLNPANTTATPNPTATTQPVAFAGVSSAANAPFTSGIAATTTAPSARTSTAAAIKAADRGMGITGIVGMAALFGVVRVVG